tara:strand:+ start:1394 stop:1537 length:144 start_codon:yes stop_codon:yes gene_type:complete
MSLGGQILFRQRDDPLNLNRLIPAEEIGFLCPFNPSSEPSYSAAVRM